MVEDDQLAIEPRQRRGLRDNRGLGNGNTIQRQCSNPAGKFASSAMAVCPPSFLTGAFHQEYLDGGRCDGAEAGWQRV